MTKQMTASQSSQPVGPTAISTKPGIGQRLKLALKQNAIPTGIMTVLWMVLFNLEYYGFSSVIFNTELYEIVPGFICGILAGVIVSLSTKAPEKEVVELFDSVNDEDEGQIKNAVEA